MTSFSLRSRMVIGSQLRIKAPGSPVTVDAAKLKSVAATLTDDPLTDWDFYLPKALQKDTPLPMHKSMDETLVDVAWFFWTQSALNYCYWYHDADGTLQHWVYKGKKGFSGLVVLMQDLYNTTPLYSGDTNAIYAYLGELASTDMWGLPLDTQRFAQLREVFAFVGPEPFRRIFAKAKQANGSWHMSADLAQELADAYPYSFEDPDFLKRAQLALGMTGANFMARGQQVSFDLTAYADYRVPQVLRHLGIINYAPDLAAKVDGGRLIAPLSVDEVAIRSATLYACAELARLSGLTDAHIDAWLFLQTREDAFVQAAKPFHLSKTAAY